MSKATKRMRSFLAETPWLRELPLTAKERVLADAYEEYFSEGDIVAREGEPANSWIGVAEGLLKVSAVYRTGKVVMFTGVPEGSWVGEGSVIKRELRRYDLIAMRPSRIINVPGATFRWLLDVSIEFDQIMITRLNERLGQYIGMMQIDRLSDPVARVARSIATLYNQVLYPQMGPFLGLSQSELGELIGLTRQSIGAALKHLETEGLISRAYGGLVIRNVTALLNYQERDPQAFR